MLAVTEYGGLFKRWGLFQKLILAKAEQKIVVCLQLPNHPFNAALFYLLLLYKSFTCCIYHLINV